MQNKVNAKKARAVVVTVALILATNFAISKAESLFTGNPSSTNSASITDVTTSLIQAISSNCFSDEGTKSLATDGTIYQPAPRPSGSFATDGTIYQPAPRPTQSLATDGTIYQPAPRPSGSFATDGTIYQPAPRPSGSFATDGTIYQPAPRPS
jgi:uncharacterized protein YigE (DUF2233 family)